jgi:ligand-binding sensor domain-containing protein/two-component sensor histidine kinase
MLGVTDAFSQYPKHFIYDNENGLPSNEVYSIVQDLKGFIWIGCDAGLYKFDGVRYIPYKCKTQNSKSVTGLTISASGKLYCFNFQSQIFCLDNDSLIELKCTLPKASINNLTSDVEGNVYVVHEGGILCYNERRKQWKDFFNYSPIQTNEWVAKSVAGSLQKNIPFIYSKGIGKIENNKVKRCYQTDFFQAASSGNFVLENYGNTLWIFSKENGAICCYNDDKLTQITNAKLNKILANRKITQVKSLSDGNLWICTYKGIVRFNTKNNTADLFYHELSFSDCMIDRENNYWFTTLHSGMLRVPNLTFSVWNNFENNRLVKITTDGTHIYFASLNGMIGKLNVLTNGLKTFYTGSNADVQSFDYDLKEQSLYFNINNHLYKLNNNTISDINTHIHALKSYRKINNTRFALSSQGVFINEKKVSYEWARALKYDEQNQTVWIATNNGLQQYQYSNDEWQLAKTFFQNTQILSVDFDEKTPQIFALTFEGKIYLISETNQPTLITKLPENVQAQKLKLYHQKLYVATNKGVWIYDLAKKQWNNLNSLSGLVSENVQDLTILNNTLWIATGKGLQKIPLNENSKTPLAKIYLKNNPLNINNLPLTINYDDVVILNPEVSNYSSNGNFEYAYRINKSDWLKLPASIEQIEIQNLPTGNLNVELKAIDHLGRNSENTITLKGYVDPPYWGTWWFILLALKLISALFFYIFKRRIKNLKQKQQLEIEHIQLENDLRLSRETALKSQMNPHFVFNVMNTIKAYIYKNDKQKASEYLNTFSDLIRTFLSMSNKSLVSLGEELKMLEQYIKMEAMMLNDDFRFRKNIDETIDLQQTKIPSLIVQPFVENAFKHGLHSKTGKKELTLFICKTDENQITLNITDNGIGRQKAKKIKEAEQFSHQSFATTAVEKRIELLNRNEQRVGVVINDLFDEHNEPNGTSVIVTINVYE